MLNYSEDEFDRMLQKNPALSVNQKYSTPGKRQSKGSKYHNRKTAVDGIEFDSGREAKRYAELKIRQCLGEITELKLQPEFVLQEGFRKNGTWYREIVYRADFKYKEVATGEVVVEDSKGMQTDVFKIKHKLFEKRYPELSLRLV
jgi:hypothetical protein